MTAGLLPSRSHLVRLRLAVASSLALVAPLTLARTASAQQGTVAGIVVVEGSQRPLPGAQVTIQGDASRGAIADASGRFRISGLAGTSVTLDARMIGYRPMSQTVAVGATNVRFGMSERAVELNQVVVTGTAGATQKRELGTSVATVNAADVVAQAGVPSVETLLNGRAPGVVVLPGTGQVGAGSQVRVRGIGTFSLSSNPLIYVDGVRVNNQTGTGLVVQAFSSGVISRMNDFSPEEIENIEVLKGPAAATLYGTEAARGVINIITKKGAAGGTRYTFNYRTGTNWFMDAESRIKTNYWINPADNKLYSVNVVQTEKERGTPLFRNGMINSYAANVGGGTGLFRYFASGESSDNQGIDYANARNQKSVRTNLSVVPSEKLDLETSVGYIKSKTSLSCEAGCGGSIWGSMYSNPANLPQFCTASSPRGCGWGRGFNSSPPEAYRATQRWQDINRFTGSVSMKYNPLKWLSNRLAIGTDYTLEGDVEFRPYQTNDTISFFLGSFWDGYRYENHHQAYYNTYDYSASANFNVTPSMSSRTSVGIQYYTNYNTYLSAEGDHFPAPGLETITSAGLKPSPTSNQTKNNTLGYFAQEEWGWLERLYLTGAVRVDNNSAFGNEVKWVTYPKASLSYVASEEPRVRDRLPSLIDNLRFRAAYGASGQQPAVNTALRTLQPVAGLNSTAALTPNTFGNPFLKPERVLGTEAGFEMGLLRERVGIDFTYYHETSKDAILSRGVPPSTGFGASSQFFNAGEIAKQGIELGLKGKILDRSMYGWDMNFNVATNTAKIKRLTGTDTTIDLGSFSHRVGYAPFSWFSYRVISATWNPTTRKAENPICDDGKGGTMNCFAGNNSLSNAIIAPKVYLGRGIPAVEGSFTNSFRYGPFRAYGMIDFATGYKRLDNNLRIRCQIFYTCLEYLQPENTDPRELVQMQTSGTLRDFVIKDAKYAKLREISLSYDVPARFTSRIAAQGATFTVTGRNLHMWTPYTGLDPESMFLSGATTASNFGVDQAEYPQPATVLFNIRLNY